MNKKINLIKFEIENFKIENKKDLEIFRIKYISKKNKISKVFNEIKNLEIKEKKKAGHILNEIKKCAKKKFQNKEKEINKNKEIINKKFEDLTLPPGNKEIGSLHPITIIRYKIVSIFKKIGFTIIDGPEIENDWNNFTALNFPKKHPAREMQDTFFISKKPSILLRTHTSSVQIREMTNKKPPIRNISPGRVFRNEAISSRTHCVFHQIEGLYINKNINFYDLKETLFYFTKSMFGKKVKNRIRPSYFPFTEPSIEIDINCIICKGEGCKICKYTGWVEIMGAGMVDPNVLKNCKINNKKYKGFAFGMGLERITMLKYKINDIRLFTENDLKFLKQFSNL